MEIILVKGDVYTVATKTECTVTSANGTPLGKATAENPISFTATTDRVELSDPDAEYARVNPKYAPVKLRLLGLLGGGSTNALPAGYIAAEFLKSTGTQYIVLSTVFNSETCIELLIRTTANNHVRAFFGSEQPGEADLESNRFACLVWYDKFRFDYGSSVKLSNAHVSFNKCYLITKDEEKSYVNGELVDSNPPATFAGVYGVLFALGENKGMSLCAMYYCKIGQSGNNVHNFIPAVDTQGVPCLFDKVSKQPFYNSGTGSFIVGFTIAQARQLSKLPATGGTLTISLPSNWQEDASVVDALATAEANGWVLTYQTYEADASASSTFALRRIFVRKTQNENGQYIDADGTRWYVEWCAGIIGAEPTDHGYEPFRSIDSAVAYWGLTPYVDPEAEIFLTNQEQ